MADVTLIFCTANLVFVTNMPSSIVGSAETFFELGTVAECALVRFLVLFHVFPRFGQSWQHWIPRRRPTYVCSDRLRRMRSQSGTSHTVDTNEDRRRERVVDAGPGNCLMLILSGRYRVEVMLLADGTALSIFCSSPQLTGRR